MKKILIKNPELFQGEKYLDKNKNYFEGWYFKNTNDKIGISFIPGISIDDDGRKAFIQVITDNNSYYIDYDIEDFTFNHDPFYIKIGNNFFSKSKVHIDIDCGEEKIKVSGDLNYSQIVNINTSFLKPNIMGVFSYIPFMECNHAILMMKGRIDGILNINGNEIIFDHDISYIEKDWGVSFPKAYVWCQGNNFKDDNVSFMLSIADIPFKIFSFTGFICSLIINDHEYRFATYNSAKLIEYEVDDKSLYVVLRKGKYTLYIESIFKYGNKLKAPVEGKMQKDIYESINSKIKVTLKKRSEVIFEDMSINCGLEIVR